MDEAWNTEITPWGVSNSRSPLKPKYDEEDVEVRLIQGLDHAIFRKML